MDPSLLGSKMIYAGDPRYNDPNHQAPVMSPELRALVEKIRAEKKSEPRSRAFITAEEVFSAYGTNLRNVQSVELLVFVFTLKSLLLIRAYFF